MKLKALSIDQNIISLITALSTGDDRRLFIYVHDHQRTEVMVMRGSFHNINALTLCKVPIVREGQAMITFISDNGSVMPCWPQSDMLSTSGVIRFVSSLKKITTIKLLNIGSVSKLSELDLGTIVTVLSENAQLKSLWLGSQSVKIIRDDFVALAKKTNNIKRISEDKKVNRNDWSVNQQKSLTLSPAKEIFQDKLPIKILYAFQNIANIMRLDLSDNIFTRESAQKLASVLVYSTKLETLLLENCSLRNEGVTVIANSLKNVNTLKRLDLSNINISEVDHIAQILKANTGLQQLNIEKNYLYCAPDNKLNLAIASLMELKALSIDQNIICLMTTFSTCVDLKTLDLSGNVITEESATLLAVVLANSTKLKTLLNHWKVQPH